MFTLSGISIEARHAQPLKAEKPISLIVNGMSIVHKLLHPSKSQLSIFSMPFGMMTDCIFLHFSN